MKRRSTVLARWGLIDLATETVKDRFLTYGQALAARQTGQDVRYLDADGNIIPL